MLLFGEYTVINGGKALALPLELYHGSWRYSDAPHEDTHKYIKYLTDIDWKKYGVWFLKEKFEKEARKGIVFDSDIPLGYGVGSSGALTAAVFDQFFISEDNSISTIRDVLAEIEGYFHGKSSGLDPLVSHFNKGILKREDNQFEIINKSDWKAKNYRFYLLDSKISRSTRDFVNIYSDNCQSKDFIANCVAPLKQYNDDIITSFLEKKEAQTFELFKSISQIQFRYFKPMIIEPLLPLWEKSLHSTEHSIKLCGAGGGGFYLIMTKNAENIREAFEGFEVLGIEG